MMSMVKPKPCFLRVAVSSHQVPITSTFLPLSYLRSHKQKSSVIRVIMCWHGHMHKHTHDTCNMHKHDINTHTLHLQQAVESFP